MSTQFSERQVPSANGLVAIAVAVGVMVASVVGLVLLARAGERSGWLVTPGVLLIVAGAVALVGVYQVQPNDCVLLTLFGRYAGSDRTPGLRWANPFYSKVHADLRTQTLITPTLKVNDQRGNPIEIAAAVIWRIEDAAAATFGLTRFQDFLGSTVEAALREVASQHPYDHADEEDPHEITLRAHVAEVSANLRTLLRERMHASGGAIDLVETRLTHLAYAPEIANAMLRRQQAEAVVGARKKIVLGAVSMVDEALRGLSQKGIVLDDERRAAMVGNLLVVLCAEREAQPVVNAGGLYSS